MSLILRGLIAIPLLIMLAMIGAAGFLAVEPIYQMVSGQTHLGNLPNLMLMLSLSLISLPVVVIFWFWIASLRNDVRQNVR